MTSDELERAIDFLLKSGARCDARIEHLSEVVERLSEKVDRISEKVDRQSDDLAQLSSRQDSYADTQAHIMQVMMQTYERQAEFNKSLRESMRKEDNELREYIRGVAAAGAATDRRLNALIEAMDRGRDAGR